MSTIGNKTAINFYRSGEYLKAFDLWQEDIERNIPQAFTNIGLLYLKGEGVPRDIQKAKEYFLKGISFNCNSSYFNLGVMYQNSIGVELDEDKAIEYFKKASLLNHEGAAFRLALMFLSDKTNKELLKEGFEYMFQAAQNNSLLAQIRLNGFNVENKEEISNQAFFGYSKDKQIEIIEDALTRYVRPILKNDGGDVLLVDLVKKDTYQIRLVYTGKCDGCSMASTTTFDLIQKTLTGVVDESIKVLII